MRVPGVAYPLRYPLPYVNAQQRAVAGPSYDTSDETTSCELLLACPVHAASSSKMVRADAVCACMRVNGVQHSCHEVVERPIFLYLTGFGTWWTIACC